MNKVVNREKNVWERPWMIEKFDDLYNRDERFLSILIKGALSWLTRNIVMYNKPIHHFIYSTGSSYMYVEANGYELSWSETTGENTMYMQMPRCIVELGSINIPTEELTTRFVRMTYERKNSNTNNIEGFNAETRRLPIEMSLSCHYVLSNMNEALILSQELIDKIVFQRFFNIIYLGNTIQCSLEFPQDISIQINKVDMSSPDVNQKTIDIELKLASSYPIIDERTELSNSIVINTSEYSLNTHQYDIDNNTYDVDKLTVE